MTEYVGNGEPPKLELEKTLASGEICTLNPYLNQWMVDMWTKDGENRWNRFFKTYEEAKAEYDRW